MVRRPNCKRCLHRGFDIVAPALDGRPRFKCQRCDNTWSCGKSGGVYLRAAQNYDPARHGEGRSSW